jgi:hypothetical protein
MEKLFEINNDNTFTATIKHLKKDLYWERVFDEYDYKKINKLQIEESVIIKSALNNNNVTIKRIV